MITFPSTQSHKLTRASLLFYFSLSVPLKYCNRRKKKTLGFLPASEIQVFSSLSLFLMRMKPAQSRLNKATERKIREQWLVYIFMRHGLLDTFCNSDYCDGNHMFVRISIKFSKHSEKFISSLCHWNEMFSHFYWISSNILH